MTQQNNRRHVRGPFLLCAMGAFAATYFSIFVVAGHVNPVYALLLGSLLAMGYRHVHGLKEKRRQAVCAAAFSACLACALLLGSKVNLARSTFGQLLKRDILFFAALCFTVFPAAFLLLEYFCAPGRHSLRQVMENKRRRQLSAGSAALIFLFYLFTYFCYFPAISTFDSWAVLVQATGKGALSNWHPILYTMLVRLFTGHGLWSLQTGVALFSLAQMLFMAMAAGYVIHWLLKKRLHPLFAVVAALYYALPPVFAAFSMTVWKDVPFAAVAVLYILCLHDLLESGGRLLRTPMGILRYVLLVFFTGMLRHNGYYVVLVITAVLLIYFAVKMKKQSLRLLPVFLLALALIPLANQIAYSAGVKKSPDSEALSIPVQQIARTVVQGGNITPMQREQLALYFDLAELENYNPFLADPAKNSIRQDYFQANKSGFFRLWLSLLPGNFYEYIRAYLLQTHGYWHPGDKPDALLDPTANAFSKLGIEKRPLLEQDPLTQTLKHTQLPYDFLSIGTMVWLMLFCALVLLARRHYTGLISLLPVLGVWGTIMVATPTACSFRYIYVLSLALPVILFIALAKQDVENDAADNRQASAHAPEKAAAHLAMPR